MEPLMNDKREVASFIPYRKRDGTLEFYLQKRDMNAPVHAGIFSLFGGGIERGEEVYAALIREVREELVYEPRHPVYFSRFETATKFFHVFIEDVDASFETSVDVQEGEYGKFLSSESTRNSEAVSDIAMLVTRALEEYLLR